jgi:uncharacterized protein YoxC
VTTTYEFSVVNAIFSSLFTIIVLGSVLWFKLRRQRLDLNERMERIQRDMLPVTTSMQQLASGMLIEKVNKLEEDMDQVTARLQHIETMIEAFNHRP